MNPNEPKVQLSSRYTVSETCELLGIHRNSLRKYTLEGRIKSVVRKSTAKKFYLGSEILKFWQKQI
jgi:predicted site-specific integrase-resolvase